MWKKILLIAGGALCLIGIAVALIGVNGNGGQLLRAVETAQDTPHTASLPMKEKAADRTESRQEGEQASAASSVQLTKVQVQVENQPVRVVRGSTDQLLVDYVEYPGNTYELTEQDGVASFVQKTQPQLRLNLTIPQDIVVRLPADFRGELEVTSSNGRVRLGGVELGNLSCTASNASVQVDGLYAAAASFRTTNGSVKLENLLAASLEVHTANGGVELDEVRAESDLTVETGNGRIELGDVTADRISAVTDNARISLDDVKALSLLTAETENGGIEVDGILSPDTRLKTRNGRIAGELAGRETDYAIAVTKHNGSCNLDSRLDGERKLTVESYNGSIHIGFDPNETDIGCDLIPGGGVPAPRWDDDDHDDWDDWDDWDDHDDWNDPDDWDDPDDHWDD